MTGSNSVPKGCIAAQDIGEATYFISRTADGKLTESAHGEGWTNPISIGSAKPDSVATYLDTGDKRHVICLNAKNQLQDYEYDADEGEWLAGNLHKLQLTAHPKTTISATYGNGAGRLYFQNPSGKIQEVVHRDGKWKPSNGYSAHQLEFGAYLASAVVQDTAHVFYTHPDHSIHQIIVKEGDEWHDSLLDGTDDGLVKLSIAAGAGDNGFALKYVNVDQECFLYAGGKSAKVGHITKDGFSPLSNAQGFQLIGGTNNKGNKVGNINANQTNTSTKVNVGVGIGGSGVSVPVKTIVGNNSTTGDVGGGIGGGNVIF